MRMARKKEQTQYSVYKTARRDMQFIELIQKSPGLTTGEVAKKFKMTHGYTNALLRQLQRSEVLESEPVFEGKKLVTLRWRLADV